MPPAQAHGEVPVEPEALPPPDELPPVEELVGKIPAETRALLDDLFRAKFTTVRRVPATALNAAAKSDGSSG